jgi:predicted kinase
MTKPNILLVGIPASGKSTLCAKLAELGYAVISTDAARAVLTGDPGVQHPWPEVWAVCMTMAAQAKTMGQPLVYDATNVVPKYRKAAFELDPDSAWEAWVLHTSVDEALRRNAARDRVVPEPVIRGMAAALVMPSTEEGFTVVRHLQ